MPKNQNRVKTSYPGVYYVEGVSQTTGKKERVYYIRYRRDGRLLEEKAGRQFQDDMTPARAALIRGQRIEGKQESNQERREAARAAKEAEAGRWTIDRLWAEYKAHRVDNKGLRVDENRFKNYLAEPFGKKEPHELIQLDIDRLRIRLLKKLSPQTVRHILALLKRIVLFGARKGLCADLAFSIEMPKVDNQKTEDLTPDQLNALLEALDNSSNFQVANLMRLALFTGMRRGELLRLQWQDVDFDRGFIRITESKGGKASSIPLNDPARELLGRHPKTGSPYMFPGRGGKQRQCIKRAANQIKKTAGLPADFRALHGLRHVYASMLASSGQVDMYTLQKLLTHKSPQMTQRYAHLRDEALKKASALAGDLITQAATGQTQGKVVSLEDHKK